jgi:modulator of FtsH protease
MQIDIEKNDYAVVGRKAVSTTTTNVLYKTYLLLSLTVISSAITAFYAMVNQVKPLGPFVSIIGMLGLLYLTQAFKNSRFGLILVFAFTSFMGYMLAPTLTFFLHNFSNGGAIVSTALAGTGLIFFLLSAFVLITKKDFSFMGGCLFVGISVAFIASLISIFFPIPVFQVLVSGVFMLLCSGLILFHTGEIIRGGETNYITATISLYVALLNIFVSLLNILGFFAGSSNRN